MTDNKNIFFSAFLWDRFKVKYFCPIFWLFSLYFYQNHFPTPDVIVKLLLAAPLLSASSVSVTSIEFFAYQIIIFSIENHVEFNVFLQNLSNKSQNCLFIHHYFVYTKKDSLQQDLFQHTWLQYGTFTLVPSKYFSSRFNEQSKSHN